MKKAKIMIIDDEEEMCEITKKLLERTRKFEAMFLTTGVGAVDLVKSYKPDLILLDESMPDMSGSEVAEHLFEEPLTKDIPVAFLTALVKSEEVKRTSGLIGGRFFIAKPVAPDELISRIESILKQYKSDSAE
ncbi:MAG: response regulator [Candidatus Omnitrophica bacterium]|nr:response regulator [Candidatus Omnitrophota bacterium]